MGIKGLEIRVGQKCCISRRGPDCTVEIYMSVEFGQGVTVLWQRGAAPIVRAAKSSEFG